MQLPRAATTHGAIILLAMLSSGYDIGFSGGRKMTYETPTIIQLGSVADFTRGDSFAWEFDGFFSQHLLGNTPRGGTPTS
jgi:hypothetical protein